MENRAQWGTRAGFIMAAVGSAIGLGNIWRFPYVAYDNGGGAFFLPYLFALLTAGIPILILEFSLGHKYRGSAPLSFARLNKKFEWLGWWQTLIAFVIATYYSVIIGWAMSYTYFSVNKAWGEDTGEFLMDKYLQVATPGEFGGMVPGVFIPLVIVWAITLGILFKGVKKGIEVANRIFIPALVVLFLIVVVRAVTLPGAATGLDALFKPDWSRILDGSVWVAAYSQIFFSVSICFAIMITYSSYLPKKSDINGNAFIMGFSNSGFELLAGIGVFSTLGFLATQSGLPVKDVASQGVGLAFAVFPEIINQMPVLSELFGVLFFTSLTLAGLTSLVSICETYVAGFQEKFGISRNQSVLFGVGLSAIISILYATRGGLNFLDVVDHFVLGLGIGLAGLVEVILIAWILKEVKQLQQHTNDISDFKVGTWWRICLTIITPIILGVMMVQSIYKDIVDPYGGGNYPITFLITYGWVALGLTFVAAIIFSRIKWDSSIKVHADKEVNK